MSLAYTDVLLFSNLSLNISVSDIKMLLTDFGKISQICINNRDHSASVYLRNRNQIKRAISKLNGIVFKGKKIKLSCLNKKTTISLKNIPLLVSNEQLFEIFSRFGQLCDAKILVNNQGNPIGTGIIVFYCHKTADQVLSTLQKYCFYIDSQIFPVVAEQANFSFNLGWQESNLTQNDTYFLERKNAPRFEKDVFEKKIGNKFKLLYYNFDLKVKQLNNNLKLDLTSIENTIKHNFSKNK